MPSSYLGAGGKFPDTVVDLSTGLSLAEKRVEVAFHDAITENPVKFINYYFQNFGKVIDADKAKELSQDYQDDPLSMARVVHEPSSRLSKMIFTEALKRMREGDSVLFSAGGSGSGKTEAMDRAVTGWKEKYGVVFDSTMSGLKSGIKKIDEALAAGMKVDIVYTNADVESAFAFSIGRKRVITIPTMTSAHVGASGKIRALAKHYSGNPNVAIRVVNNLGSLEDISEGTLDDVFKYSGGELERRLNEIADQALAEGKISAERHVLTAGQEGVSGVNERNGGQAGSESAESHSTRQSGVPLGRVAY